MSLSRTSLLRHSEHATFRVPFLLSVPWEKDRVVLFYWWGNGRPRAADGGVPTHKKQGCLPRGRGTLWRTIPVSAPSWVCTVLPGLQPQTSLGPTCIPPVTRGHIPGPSLQNKTRSLVQLYFELFGGSFP